MDINLKSNHIIAFGFKTTIFLPSEIITQIREVSPPSRGGASLFEELNLTGGNWMALAELSEVRKFNNKFSIEVTYFPSRQTHPNKSKNIKPSVSDLFEALSAFKEKVDFECTITLLIKKSKKPTPLIKLPMTLSEFPSSLFGELYGVHIVSRDGDNLTHVVIDVQSNGGIGESVTFVHSGHFHRSISDEIMNRAIEISKLYVVRE